MNRMLVNTQLGVYASLWFYLFFDSYRYIWGEGGIGTSGENATPILANILKTSIWLALIIYPWIICKYHKVKKRNYLVILLLSIIVVQKIYMILILGDYNTKDLSLLLMVMLCMSYMFHVSKIDLSIIDKILLYFFVFTIIYNLIQIVLAINLIKIPRHAYITGYFTDIRFGGAWDDPNSYGLFMVFYVLYFYRKYADIKRWFLMGAAYLNIIMTWSITAIGCSAVALIICMLLPFTITKIKYISFVILIMISIIIVYVYNYGIEWNDLIIHMLDAKSGSADEHMSGWSFANFDVLNLLGLRGHNYFSEIGFLNMLYSGGAILVFCFYLLGIVSIYQFMRLNKSRDNKRTSIMYGAIGYQLVVMISTFNLPLQTVWPVGCLFYFFVMLSSVLIYDVDNKELSK